MLFKNFSQIQKNQIFSNMRRPNAIHTIFEKRFRSKPDDWAD